MALALFLGGCGGDDNDGGDTGGDDGAASTTASNGGSANGEGSPESIELSGDGSAMAKAQYIKRADAICEQIKNEIVAAAVPDENQESLERFFEDPAAGVNEILVPSLEKEIDQLSALGAPAGDEAQIEALLTEIQAVVDRAKAEPEAFAKLDTTNPRQNPYRHADKLASAYGLSACPRI